jgi:hypothetical protein
MILACPLARFHRKDKDLAGMNTIWISDLVPVRFVNDCVSHARAAIAAIGWHARWPVPGCVLAAALFMFGGAASDLHHGGSDFDGHPLVLQKLPRQFGTKLRQCENGFPLVSECRRRIFREWRQLSDAIAALSTNALKQSSWYRTRVTDPVKSAGPC